MRISWQVFASPCVCLDKLIRNRWGMRLMQDGATSYTEHTTLKLIESNLPWPDLNWDVIDTVVKTGPFNVRQLQPFVMDGWKAIAQHTCLRNFDAQLSPGRHPSKWRSCQVSSQMDFVVRIEFRNFMNVLM